jgi:hypothetical protein
LQVCVSSSSLSVALPKPQSRAERAVVLSVFPVAPAGGATHKPANAAGPIFKGGAWKFRRRVRNSEVPLMRFAGVTVRPTRTIAKDSVQTYRRNTTANVARPEKPSRRLRVGEPCQNCRRQLTPCIRREADGTKHGKGLVAAYGRLLPVFRRSPILRSRPSSTLATETGQRGSLLRADLAASGDTGLHD